MRSLKTTPKDMSSSVIVFDVMTSVIGVHDDAALSLTNGRRAPAVGPLLIGGRVLDKAPVLPAVRGLMSKTLWRGPAILSTFSTAIPVFPLT